VRAPIRILHEWSGLLAGLLLALLGVTGSILVYRTDIEAWQTRQWRQVQPVGVPRALDDLVAVALATAPRREFSKLVLPAASGETLQVYLQKPRPRTLKEADLHVVFVDPYRGVVLGTRALQAGWLYGLQDFHYALFAEGPGLRVNGVAAAVLLALALSGPVLWWPGWQRRREAFRVRRRPATAHWRDLHATIGVAAMLVLAILAVTAFYYAYRDTATAAVTLVSGNGAVLPPSAVADGAPLTIASWVAAARAAEPRATFHELRLPRRKGGTVSISFRLPDDETLGPHRLFVDPASARVLRVDRFDALPLGARVIGSMGPWHFGSFGGRATQAIWCGVGLVPAFLFGSGVWTWWRRRSQRRASTPVRGYGIAGTSRGG
jgi:uncharacterized iron-regulated membrane protein